MPTFHRPVSPFARTRARETRHEQTETEKALWRLLRDRRLAKMKWRRQFPIGRYIVDFVCLDHRIIVECDGSQHADDPRDAERDAWLNAQGFSIARFWNYEVLSERTIVMNTILARCGLPW